MLSSTNVVNHHHFKISVTIYNGDAPSITTIDLALAPVTQIHELFFFTKKVQLLISDDFIPSFLKFT